MIVNLKTLYCESNQKKKNMKNLSKKEFYNQLQWLQNSVILPNGHRVSKIEFVTSNGFDFDGMYDLLDRYYDKWFKDPSMVEGSRM